METQTIVLNETEHEVTFSVHVGSNQWDDPHEVTIESVVPETDAGEDEIIEALELDLPTYRITEPNYI